MGEAPAATTVQRACNAAAARLSDTSDTARLDAEVLMAHALGKSRSDMLLRHQSDPAPGSYSALIERRLADEPIAYITGHQEFYGLDFAVTPAVLIPRGDSEVLIEAARAAFAGRAPARIIDLGTGSGALLIAALSVWPEAYGVGVDRSPDAIEIAAENAIALDLSADWHMMLTDWGRTGWSADLGLFDLILANPPYVEDAAELAASVRDHEPPSALFAGPEGLDDYRVLIPQLPRLLAPDGVAIVEIGASQAEPVAAIASAAGMTAILHRDLAGRPRALEMRAKPKNSLGNAHRAA